MLVDVREDDVAELDEVDLARYGRDVGEMWARCGRDVGEMWGRYMWGRYRGELDEVDRVVVVLVEGAKELARLGWG